MDIHSILREIFDKARPIMASQKQQKVRSIIVDRNVMKHLCDDLKSHPSRYGLFFNGALIHTPDDEFIDEYKEGCIHLYDEKAFLIKSFNINSFLGGSTNKTVKINKEDIVDKIMEACPYPEIAEIKLKPGESSDPVPNLDKATVKIKYGPAPEPVKEKKAKKSWKL